MKRKDVNLPMQKYKGLINKGTYYREVYRTIKDITLPFWIEKMETCRDEDYVFSKDLMPMTKLIRVAQISRRWKHYVKKPLGIKADFYTLKRLNTDATVEALGMADAAAQNAHTSTNMFAKLYAIN